MRILSINSVPYGSTAKIMIGISKVANQKGIYALTSTGYSMHPIPEMSEQNIPIGGIISKSLHMFLAKVTGYNGCFSRISTLGFIQKLKKIKPDIVHIHNLHCWYINIPMLFRYIKRKNIKVVWTFHDCWPFTGDCPHFTIADCDKWKTECEDCTQYKEYPQCLFDNSKIMYNLKRKWFLGIKDLTIVTPSEWLATLVKQSFFRGYPVKVINNGIDLSVFKPTVSDFRKKYLCEGKNIILGVSFGWDNKKGIDVFIELSQIIDSKYQIVLVGTDSATDKLLPDNIISIHRTQNQTELAQIYSAADLFVNPTREENFPTVNIEALACGTPVLTFRTGGSPETIDETCGSVVSCDDIDSIHIEIERICKERPYSEKACIKRAKRFDRNECFEEYLRIYKEML